MLAGIGIDSMLPALLHMGWLILCLLSISVLWNAGMDNFLMLVDLMGELLGMT
jgi:hypothetical protein